MKNNTLLIVAGLVAVAGAIFYFTQQSQASVSNATASVSNLNALAGTINGFLNPQASGHQNG